MKKFLALILALVMVTALSVTAFAAPPVEGLQPDDNYDVVVSGIYDRQDNDAPVYGVDISWAGLEFTYTETFAWNAEDKAYTDSTGGRWQTTSGTLTVTNRSNAAIIATLRDSGEYDLVIDGVADAPVHVELDSVTDPNPEAILTKTVTVSLPDGAAAITEDTTLATINVAITAVGQ